MTLATARLLCPTTILLALASGCTEVPDENGEFRESGGCVTCTLNSPQIDDAPFPELALDGEPNLSGVSLVGLRPPPPPFSYVPAGTYTLGINQIEDLVALDANNQPVAAGAGLQHWQLVLDNNGDEVAGNIITYDMTPSWSDSGRPLTVYAIYFFDGEAQPPVTKNVCPTFAGTPAAPVLTIIPGATYDRDAKAVALIDDNWVTFACQDQAAYKAKALGYEEGRNLLNTGGPATRDQQDATLKMITADYCGTGHSFTEQGTAVLWEDRLSTVTVPASEPTHPIEAVWGPTGALCLNEPRLFPRLQVVAECPLPNCDAFEWKEEESWVWVSYKVD